MAKKVRTPPPPRRVQAPQKRDRRRTAAAGAAARSPWLYALGGGAVVAIAAVAVVLFLVLRNDNGSSTEPSAKTPNYNSLPGVRKTKAPWPPEYTFLGDRLKPLGLSPLSAEGQVLHIHQHLDIFVNGKKVSVPKFIGINDNTYITELHTHDPSGIIHVESPVKKTYTLGQFIGEWGVFFSSRCLGAYCDGVKAYVNGKLQSGNPANIPLKEHEQIALVVGKPPKKIPSTYDFAKAGV